MGEDEKAAERKIGDGLRLMRRGMGTDGVTVIIDNDHLLSENIATLVAIVAMEWGWEFKRASEMVGAEADRVLYIGYGQFEAVSRARLFLGILLCCQTENRGQYNNLCRGYHAAIEQGLVLVATLPSHPQVADNCI